MSICQKGRTYLAGLLILMTSTLVLSCQPSGSTSLLPVQIDQARADRVLSFYLGSYADLDRTASPDTALFRVIDGVVHLDLQRMNSLGLSQPLQDLNNDQVINWEELEPFLTATYYEARNAPQTLNDLYALTSTPQRDSAWMTLEIDGMMVEAKREIFVKEARVREALQNYRENDNQILYPTGTTFVGNHYVSDELIETTVSQKRADGFWDFFIYDRAGNLATSTETGPKELTSPTRCVGCHFGSKLFEPEVSFPGEANDGPFGPRGIHVGEEARDEAITEQLDEHAKRSDTILGVYGTIYLSQLRSRLESRAKLTEEELSILKEMDLLEDRGG